MDNTRKFYENSSLDEITNHLKDLGVDFVQIDETYKRINSVNELYKQVNSINDFYKRVNGIDNFYKQINSADEFYKQVNSIDESHKLINELDNPYKLIDELADPKIKRWFWLDDIIVKIISLYYKIKIKLKGGNI